MAKKKTTKKTTKAAAAKPPTKGQVFGEIAEANDLTRKQVSAVFDSLAGIMQKSLRKHGVFTIPGMAKATVRKKPATKARKGINPFTGEEIMIKAKPASKTVRVRPLKAVKEMV